MQYRNSHQIEPQACVLILVVCQHTRESDVAMLDKCFWLSANKEAEQRARKSPPDTCLVPPSWQKEWIGYSADVTVSARLPNDLRNPTGS